ncbi:MAG: SURF1 family protein [Sphingomonas sp.]
MIDPGARHQPAPFDDAGRGSPGRSGAKFALLLGLCVVFFAGFVSLGVWQVHRRAWKLALIDRVNARVHAAPIPAPGPTAWPAITADTAYTHVTVTGRYENARETLIQANTELGPGFWVLTPFDTTRGFTLLVNRGFVPLDHRDPATRARGQIAGVTTVSGLLRVTEPGGAFLRHNDPAHDRWYSRDVAAIARARGLGTVAPYFVDADRAALPADAPVGGLTVIHFRNAHLQYALIWFGLALLSLVGAGLVLRDRIKPR